jgi:hypothetical protein
MGRFPDGFKIGSAVRAEVFVIWLNGAGIELTGPSGPAPWAIELEAADHPVDVVDRLVRERFGPPVMVHSTSWRHDGDALILSFVVVVEAASVRQLASAPIPRVELARSEATAPPDEIGPEQVLEHALRHLAWLATEDPTVSVELPDRWRAALAAYAPEPFRNLG